MYCGIGTHFVPSSSIEGLRQALCSEDVSSDEKVDQIIRRFSKTPGMSRNAHFSPYLPSLLGESDLKKIQAKIDYCFGADTVEGKLI